MKIILIGLAAASTFCAPAMAGVSLIAGLGNPSSQVTGGAQTSFADIATGSYTSVQAAGMTFDATPGSSFEISDAYDGQFNNEGVSLQGSFDIDSFQTLNVGFSAPVQAFAFNFGGADTNWLLEAFDGFGNSLGVVTLLPTGASNAGTFYGIASSAQDIARAVLSVDVANYDPSTLRPDYVFVDNATTGQFTSPVPEPGEWAMIVAGLAIVGGAARRRARRA